MNSTLVEMLTAAGEQTRTSTGTAAGVPELRDSDAWRRVLVVNNLGAVPGDQTCGDIVANRGFNFVVLDEHGRPAFFCKCRPRSAAYEGPSSLAARLSRVPELADIVPRTWSVHTDIMDMEVSRYLRGDLLERRVAAMGTPALGAAFTDILAAAATISSHAARLEPCLLDGAPDVALIDAAEWILEALVDAGVESPRISTLARALTVAGRIPRALQHGDLWPRNALLAAGHWHILDFEQYGRVQIPLYDVLHLVMTSWHARRGPRRGRSTWLGDLTRANAESDVYRAALRRSGQQAALTPLQAGGALVYYFADIAARMCRRGVSASYTAPYLLEVRRLAEWIDDGGEPGNLFQ